MNPETLRKIFKSSFNYTTYSNEIVHRLFNCNDVATNPELLDTNAEGDKSYFIGQMEDADGRLLGFFYTRVADGGDVRRKRVGLRKLIQPYLKYDVDGAIAVFDDGNHWRLSYICDLKEGNTAAKRFSYILGDEQGQYKTPLERLGRVAEKNGRFKLSDLKEAFSVDALSKEFFDEYHRHYDIIINELKGQGFEGATIHDYVKKMMGRIVFLHFLQKKGWLNGNLAFLHDLFFFSPHQGDFLEQVLEPLFFGIFNTEDANREQLFKTKGWDMGLLEDWKELPYLNGGLFERDAVDEQNITLPASLFEDLFTFMASYNFTVDENDPDDAEVGVDPEMLGKIFESLLEDNKAKGAFYTPKEIVRYMCKESLVAYLGTRTSSSANGIEASIRAFVETHEMQPELEPYRDTLDQALRNVKICDPAIGSGAFPMGLLNELWRCREALAQSNSQSELKEQKENHNNIIGKINSDNSFSSDCKKETSDCMMSRVELKKEIIENNIYGVDIEKGAIDIARLRFWLSIVVDAEEPEPLPNFDYKFMQGNSLIESFEGFDLSRISSRLRGGQSKSMQLVLGIDSHTSRQNLQRLLREYFSVTDHKKKASMRQAINEEVKTLIRESVGGTPTSLAKLEKMDCSANQDFFLWHTWFKDIFDKGGFDIIVANPPYIGEKGHKDLFQSVKQDPALTEFYYGKMDYFYFFFHLSINLLHSNGVGAFISTNYYPTALGAKKLRLDLEKRTNILQLINFNEYKIFESALGQHNLITMFEKNSLHSKESKVINNSRKGNVRDGHIPFILDGSDELVKTVHISHNKLFEGENHYIRMYVEESGNKQMTSIFDKMTIGNQRLGDIANVNTGLFTACDKVFIDEIDSILYKFKTNPLEQTLLKPLFKNSDIEKYVTTEKNSKVVIYHHEKAGYKLSEIPNIYAYLLRHKEKLQQRRDNSLKGALKRGRWDVIALPKISINFEGPKIVAPQRSKSNTFGYNKVPWYASADVYFITNPLDGYKLKYILGLLNSKLYYVWLYNKGKRKGESLELYQKPLSEIPIKKATSIQQREVADLVDAIIVKKKQNPKADTSDLEREIDQHVYALYNLTPEEIAMIEKNSQ